jgi:voltage-gated sodium channel
MWIRELPETSIVVPGEGKGNYWGDKGGKKIEIGSSASSGISSASSADSDDAGGDQEGGSTLFPKRRGRQSRRKRGQPSELLKQKSWLTWLQLTETFDLLIMTAIIFNAVMIGVELEARDPEAEARGEYGNPSLFVLIEWFFIVVFSFELIVRYLAYIKTASFWKDPEMWHWNLFDGLLVGLMWFEMVLQAMMGGGADLAMFSVMRLARLLRLTRLMRLLPELQMMVLSLTKAVRSVNSTLLLLLMLVYVFSIIFTEWAKKALDETLVAGSEAHGQLDNDFGNLGVSFLSLFQVLVYDSVFELIRRTLQVSPTYGVLLLVFLAIGSMTVMNMLIGVIVEIVSATKADAEERQLVGEIKNLFGELDEDGDGTITVEEFEKQGYKLQTLGLDLPTCGMAFELANGDGTDSIYIEDLETVLIKLLHAPQSQDILMVNRNVQYLCKHLGFKNPFTNSGVVSLSRMREEMEAKKASGHDNFEKKVKEWVDVRIGETEEKILRALGKSAPSSSNNNNNNNNNNTASKRPNLPGQYDDLDS